MYDYIRFGCVIVCIGLVQGCADIADQVANVSNQESKVVCDNERAINEDSYVTCSFNVLREVSLRVEAELVTGVSVEVYFLTDQSYQVWETSVANGQFTSASFTSYQEFSRAPLSGIFDSGWYRIQKGKYYLLIENTDYGNTMPPFNFLNDYAVVNYKVTVKG